MAGSVICSRCGHANEADQTFCSSCGAFLEWSGERVEGEASSAAAPGDAPPAAEPIVRAGVPAEPAVPAEPRPSQAEAPPLVTPVRPGPAARSVPPPPDATSRSPVAAAAPAAPTAPVPTIACPSCGRPNPLERTFCHSCGTLLRPKPVEPGRSKRGAGDGRTGLYRLVSLVLLLAIIIVGSFLLTRLGSPAGSPSPAPSSTPAPTRAWTAPVSSATG